MTINLKTGEQYPPRREDYCTLRAGTKMDPNMATPLWDAHTNRVTAGDVELQKYLQRVAGYCMTGDISEHALFFAYGTGRNGKGVFLRTVAGCLGDYAINVPTEVLMTSRQERHPTELARLHRARLAYASETEEGRHWNETRIKDWTGGDPITGRFMRQDFFTFKPQFKLFITGNHRPSLRGVDPAIQARMNLIPFTVTIPPEERDLQLDEKLRKEWPGILAWMMEGCREWQRIGGLRPPPIVINATNSYLATQDGIGAWLAENCVEGPGNWTRRSALYDNWTDWAVRNGERVTNRKLFIDAMEARHFVSGRRDGYDGFAGVALRGPAAGVEVGGDPDNQRPRPPDDIPF